MKKKRFREEEIVKILKEGESGINIDELARRYNISRRTYYNWRSKYKGLEISELKRLKIMEKENNRLKTLLAEAHLDIKALKDVLSKKW
jgi:putative transposase